MVEKPTYEELGNRIKALEEEVILLKQKEKVLRESEANLAKVQQVARLGFWQWDIITNELYWSDETYRLAGFPPQSFVPTYDDFISLLHPEDREFVLKAVDDVLQGIRAYNIDHRIIIPAGEIRYVCSQGDVTRDETNAPIRMVGTMIDITDSKLVEKALEESHDRLLRVLDSLDAIVYVADIETGELLFLNKYSRDVFGDVVGKTCWQSLQFNQSGPCEFCTNKHLLDSQGRSTGVYVWEFQNTIDKKWYDVRDRAIKWIDDRMVRLEIASDISERRQAEENQRLQSEIMTHMSEGINLVRANDGVIVFVNPKFAEMFGYSPGELPGKHVSILNAPTEITPEELAAQISASIMDHGHWQGEIRNIRKNGAPFWCYASISVFDHYQHGQVYVSIHTDITERKRAEDALEKSENFLQTVLNAFPDPLMVIGLDYRIALANKAAMEIVGNKKSERPLLCHQVSHGSDIPCSEFEEQCPIKQVIATGQEMSVTHTHYDAEGRDVFVEVSAAPIFGENGEVTQIIEACRDITERLQAENMLKKSESRYQDLYDNAPDMFASVDVKSERIIQCNQTLARQIGYRKEEIIDQHITFLYHPDCEEERKKLFQEFLSSGTVLDAELQLQRKDGTKLEVSLNVSAVRDENGEIVHSRTVWRDITGYKRIAEERESLRTRLLQSQKMEAIGTLAGGIAHDFNNILTPILGYTEIVLKNLPVGSSNWLDLQEVDKASLRAKELVQQILAFSRQTRQERKPVQVHLIVKEALKLLRSSLPTSIEIIQRIDTHCDYVVANPTQIHQIVMNLCTNAYHAMRKKGGVLDVSMTSCVISPDNMKAAGLDIPPGPYLKLQVSDTGCGMDKITQERIFEPYFTTKEKGEGTGLGLAVVHSFIEDHDGYITFSSTLGEGTIFRIYLPRIDTDAIPHETFDAEAPPRGSERILLVDDEKVIVAMEQNILENLGYSVTSFVRSADAFQRFMEHPEDFDLVLTDMYMPKMTGVDLARRILAVRSDLPIVICTGHSEQIDEVKAKALGFRAFLKKPFGSNVLAKVIRMVLDEK
ncbi:PAS domain S-box protein [Thermodesulfobacteriota bacterium]